MDDMQYYYQDLEISPRSTQDEVLAATVDKLVTWCSPGSGVSHVFGR
jgi:hypothetical protein